jgi:ribosome-associated protein|tara:strand:+ start:2308 stop:2679 length:372 start_codon:yes stop_codon:yes gene_type:complete
MVIYLLVSKKINKNKSNIVDSIIDILLIQNIKDIKIYEPKSDVYSDYVIISTASSNVQMNSALMKIIKYIKSVGTETLSEGMNTSWILLQSNGVTLHIFTEESREYYSIEDLYFDSNLVNQYG